jgi:hypothetical protein
LERKAEFHRSPQFLHREQEPAVAEDRDGWAIGAGDLPPIAAGKA